MKDFVQCNYCGFKGTIKMGQENCPKCGKVGFLGWIENEKQETD